MWIILIPPIVMLSYVLAFVWIGIFIKIMGFVCPGDRKQYYCNNIFVFMVLTIIIQTWYKIFV